ncbi:MAG TPA: aromatic ring-hydroxylating dioxygenase subunit alpha [Candidatus Limnocylindrales bacterium]|nr:aromatic ring-hydroxylating dioxygenase subunit alpha [Candidatus Limnocylindrales bacterium]
MTTEALTSPISAADVAATRRPVDEARLLPPHVFHDPQVFDYEMRAWFSRAWLCVAREEDVREPGSYVLARLPSESAIVVRDRSGLLHALSNVCRHRGATMLDHPSGRVVRLQCPYHAWIYDLDGSLLRAPHTADISNFDKSDHGLRRLRVDTWEGYVFVNFDVDAPPLAEHLADLPAHVSAHAPGGLRRARRIEYDVSANWKVIAENYSECYHCPGVHPQLNRLTPYDRGQNFESSGPWAGGWMELIEDAETMSTDGHNNGRPPLPGVSAEDERRIYYFVIWPNMLLSLHPDYVMTHQVWPVEPGRSRVICEWLFDPETMARPDFDPSDAVEFWDLTNRQDWAVCERQQKGTASVHYTAGRYSLMEDMVHAFDLMVADRYADDGVVTRFGPRHDKWSAAPRRRR